MTTDVPGRREDEGRPSTDEPVTRASRVRRWTYLGLGIFLVGLGAIGAVLPGLPTTIFLMGAVWCFARSSPRLEAWVLDTRLFSPVRGWLVPGGRVSRRSRITALVTMWAAIVFTAHLMLSGDDPKWVLAGVVVALGGIGTWFVLRYGRTRDGLDSPAASPEDPILPEDPCPERSTATASPPRADSC